MSIKNFVKKVLIEQQNKKYVAQLAAKSVTYDAWIREQEAQKALYMQESDKQMGSAYICFLMPGGKPADNAAARIAAYFAANEEAQILYGDEDVLEPGSNGEVGVRRSPWFKPDWSPDLLKCSFYFGSLVAMRRSLWEQMLGAKAASEQQDIVEPNVMRAIGVQAVAVENKEYADAPVCFYQVKDVAEFQDFIRRCVEAAGGYKRSSHAVLHVPEMLFHCESEAVWEQYDVGVCGEVVTPLSLLSVIIPSKDNPEILEQCLGALPKAAGDLPYEVIIVDNGSSEENRAKIEAMTWANQHITYLYHPMEFHFSKMCNLGAEAAKGELLLFLNDDVELVQADSLKRLAELAVQEYTGAVGMKLYYPNSQRIQHAGITNLPMGPVHKLQFLEDDKNYYFGYNRGCRNVLAVTAACLMVSAEKFRQAGGFAEELRVAFNDVDLCYNLYELGYYNVCRNDCYAYHHESLSRGDDESLEKLHRLLEERNRLFARHENLIGRDPYYSRGLGRNGLDTGIRPAYETAGNRIQRVEAWKLIDVTEYRQDNCLLLRVEDCREGCVTGYGVVLGDNNACYDRWLVLQSGENCYSILVDGQYRPDLIENMADQMNVGLCGFRVQFCEKEILYEEQGAVGPRSEVSGGQSQDKQMLPQGKYRIGMAVRNRVTGLKLINWSNREAEISCNENK